MDSASNVVVVIILELTDYIDLACNAVVVNILELTD